MFFSFYGEQNYQLGAALDYTIIEFVVVLPLVGFLWVAYGRREACLARLSEVKALMLSILRAHCEWVDFDSPDNTDLPLPRVQASLTSILAAMHAYFLPARFYSRNYPYLGYKTAMIQIALDRSRTQRAIRDGISSLDSAATALRRAGLPPALEVALHDRVMRLQVAIDQMSNVKEFGTPQGVRSLVRFYVCLIIPLIFAPYWALIGSESNFAVAFFASIAVQIALVGVLNAAIALEDPFDNNGLDGVFIDEQMYEVEQALLASGADADMLGQGNSGGGAGGGPANGAPAAPPAPVSDRVMRVVTDNV